MAIDDRTTNRSYKLPNPANFLGDDVARLRDALNAIDADVFARYTKTEVDQLIANLINGSPGALDTLNELADALGDDPNFAATVATQLALKADAANVYSKGEADARYVQRVNFNGATEVVFNDPGGDVDFRIEGDTRPNLFKIDAGLDQVQVENLNGGPLAGFRNIVINGSMATDQRNSGASQTITAGAALAYTVDRWYGYSTGANVTGQRVQGATVGQFRYQFTGAASVTSVGFGQRIEQLNSAYLAGTTATLSVDLSNSVLTTVTWTAFYATTADTFGTLASPTRTQIATGTFTVTSTVTRYSANISIPGAATTGIEIVFTVGAQTSGTWVIGDVQLEPGPVATPFERRSIGAELALCQSYYETGFVVRAAPYVRPAGVATTDSNCFATVQFRVTKRASPTMSGAGSFAAILSWLDIGPEAATAFLTANNATGEAKVGSWAASIEL